MEEHSSVRRPLRIFWSAAISGTELYDGEEVETFITDWHFHEGWQLVAVTSGERHYQSQVKFDRCEAGTIDPRASPACAQSPFSRSKQHQLQDCNPSSCLYEHAHSCRTNILAHSKALRQLPFCL
jgi:hypothetical protein